MHFRFIVSFLHTITIVSSFDCKAVSLKRSTILSAACCLPSLELSPNKWESSVWQNIDELISTVISKHKIDKWLVHVINFKREHLYNSKFPILLIWPLPVFAKSKSYWLTNQEKDKYWLRFPERVITQYLQANKTRSCKLPRGSSGIKSFGDGTSLKLEMFSSHAKPWNRHLAIHILAPYHEMISKEGFPYMRIWDRYHGTPAPSSMPNYHLVILDKQHLNTKAADIINGALESTSYYYGAKNEVVYLQNGNDPRDNLELLTKNLVASPAQNFDISLETSFALQAAAGNLGRTIKNICRNLMAIRQSHFYVDTDFDRKFDKIILEYFTSHLSNYTMYGSPNYIGIQGAQKNIPYCSKLRPNDIDIIERPWVLMSDAYAMIYERNVMEESSSLAALISPYDDLRFVSCGQVLYKSLAFIELVRVFQTNLWVAILFTVLIVLLIFHYAGIRKDVVMFLLKTILEQGNPVTERILKLRLAKYSVVVIMLAGTVLSNAYKNCNVYNMVLPRAVIRFKYFQQLLENKFEIFDRIVYTDEIFDIELESLIHQYNIGKPVLKTERRHVHILVQNETVSKQLNLARAEHTRYFIFSNNPKEVLPVFEILKLPQYTSDLMVRAYQNVRTGFRMKYFRELEYNQSLETLKQCKNVAYVVPYKIAVNAVTGHLKDISAKVHIGIESFFNQQMTVFMQGTWPGYVMKRVKLLKSESGIAGRWSKMLNDTVTVNHNIRENVNNPSGAKMSGNIMVIFSVYFAGIGFCMCWLAFENQKEFQSILITPIIKIQQIIKAFKLRTFRVSKDSGISKDLPTFISVHQA